MQIIIWFQDDRAYGRSFFQIFLFLLVCFHVMLMTLYQLWALHFACHIRMSHAKSIHFLSIIYLSGSTRQLDRRLLLRVLTCLYIADSCIEAEMTYKLILRTWKWENMWHFSMFHFISSIHFRIQTLFAMRTSVCFLRVHLVVEFHQISKFPKDAMPYFL